MLGNENFEIIAKLTGLCLEVISPHTLGIGKHLGQTVLLSISQYAIIKVMNM